VTGCLDDLVSDFSRFHGIRDVTVLGSRAFLRLARRLEFYGGIMTARAKAGLSTAAPQAAPVRRMPPRYDSTSPHANNARTAASAPPATGAFLQGMDAQLGGGWITYRTAPKVEGGDVNAR
jgi:hypothetical protein